MKILLIYILVSIIYSIISIVDSYYSFQKKLTEKPDLRLSINDAKDIGKIFLKGFMDAKTSFGKRNRIIVLNPYTILVLLFLFIICCPLFFPYTLISIFYNIFWFNTILQKEKDAEAAKKRSEEWFKNEGVYNDDIVPEPPISKHPIEEPIIREFVSPPAIQEKSRLSDNDICVAIDIIFKNNIADKELHEDFQIGLNNLKYKIKNYVCLIPRIDDPEYIEYLKLKESYLYPLSTGAIVTDFALIIKRETSLEGIICEDIAKELVNWLRSLTVK